MTMTNRSYTAAVARGEYPENPQVPLDPGFRNDAGEIQNLLLEGCRSVAVITSRPDALRANHFHKTDWHYTYVMEGRLVYFWRPEGSTEPPFAMSFQAGELFFTPPMVEHAMRFESQCRIMTFARNVRDHEHHEQDVVRVNLVK